MVNGITEGISKSIVKKLEELEDIKVERSEYASAELMQRMADITSATGKEVSVYVSRQGDIISVAIGESDRVSLEALTMRRSEERLSGLRCLHTHPNGDARLSSVDVQSLKKLRLDAMSAIGVKNGTVSGISMAVLSPKENNELDALMYYCADVERLPHAEWLELIMQADSQITRTVIFDNVDKNERIMLLGHDEASLEELAALTDTAGGTVVKKFIQKNRVGFGSGKLHELALYAQADNIDVAIYDDELTAIEQRNMEDELGVRVLDRTALILDIFAMRAVSGEGQLQVELAQAKYALTRLIGMGTVLSQQGGGIGTRGPGEKKLETDRRHIKRRIAELERQLAALGQQRALQRKRRIRQGVPQIALVGYTNVGKSTLMGVLTGAEVFAENKLFATLDPLTRSCSIAKGVEVLFTDTVGFIKKLPHQLVEAFRSTLEEAVYADILLHVCDGSNVDMFRQMQAVDDVLGQIGAGNVPRITVINKCDKGEAPEVKDGVYVSAITGQGLDELRDRIISILNAGNRKACFTIPYADGELLAFIHSNAVSIDDEEYTEIGTKISFVMPSEELGRLEAKLKDKGILK
ncbi:MAG: GTPase HflX [Clostridia bacterium]|nr:GTPase HflX [Clostridia bacterium]